MRDYIPKSKYIRPEVWKRITSVIRDERALRTELKAINAGAYSETANTKKAELERKIKAYDNVWNGSDEETRKLVKLKFHDRMAYRDILLPMSESTMKRIAGRFVRQLGKQLGEID